MFDNGKIIFIKINRLRVKNGKIYIRISKQAINKIIFGYNGSLERDYFDEWKNIV